MYAITPIVASTDSSTNRADVSATRTAFPRASYVVRLLISACVAIVTPRPFPPVATAMALRTPPR